MPAAGTPPVLGGYTLSGTKVVTMTSPSFVDEHSLPGREGGIVEQTGGRVWTCKMQGFADSGDTTKPTILNMLPSIQSLIIPSTVSGWFFSGVIRIKDFQIAPSPGYGYPRYVWMLDGYISGGVPTIVATPSGGITYVQPEQVFSQVYTSYVQPESATNAQLHVDYTLPETANMQVYTTYVVPEAVNTQAYVGYVLISGVSGY